MPALSVVGKAISEQLLLKESCSQATVPRTPLLRVYLLMLQHGLSQACAVSRRLVIKLAQLQCQRFLVVEKVTSCTASLAGALLQGYSTSCSAGKGHRPMFQHVQAGSDAMPAPSRRGNGYFLHNFSRRIVAGQLHLNL